MFLSVSYGFRAFSSSFTDNLCDYYCEYSLSNGGIWLLVFSSVVCFSSVTLCNYSPSSSDYGVAANVVMKALTFDALSGDSGASISTMLIKFIGAVTSSCCGLEQSEPDLSLSFPFRYLI